MFQAILEASPVYPSNMNAHVKDLCKKLLVVDPANRLGSASDDYQELKAHSFFKGIDFDNLVKTKTPIANEIVEKLKREKVSKVIDSDSSEDESKLSKECSIQYKVLKQGTVQMKPGWILYKKRDLILNNKHRLLYFSSRTKEFRGDIILTRNTVAVKRGSKEFDVMSSKVIFSFKGETEEDARGWVDAINNSVLNYSY
jgi:serine/threonine protein kinase